MSQVDAQAVSTRDYSWSLPVILIVALAVRVTWWALYVHGIENEGAEYCRLADNLIAGNGYVGMYGGPHVFFPPLFPWLIGVVGLVVHDYEVSARVLSLLSGLGIVGIVWTISRRLFSARVAVLTGFFSAFHPTLVAFSVSTYVEPLYTFLVLTATLFALGFVRDRSRLSLAAAGACWGLAYLTRPEAMAGGVMMAGCAAFIAYFPERRLSSVVRSGAITLGAMLVLVLPNIIWLSSIAGEFRWEGKSGANSLLNERMQAGMSYSEAALGLGGADGQNGPWLSLRDERELLAYSGSGGFNFLSSLLRNPIPRLKGTLLELGRARALGSPWVLLLAATGLIFGMSWRGKPGEALVLVGLIVYLGSVLLLTEWRYLRFFLGTLSVLLIYSPAGALLFTRTILLPRRRPAHRRGSDPAPVVLASILLAGVCLLALRPTLREPNLNQAYSTQAKDLGAVISSDYDPGHSPESRPLIMGFLLAPAFYAGGTLEYFPFAEEELALGYVHAVDPDYLVLRGTEKDRVPFVSSWLERGIPDSCAELILDSGVDFGNRARIWRWKC